MLRSATLPNTQGGVRRTPLGATAGFLGWVPGGPWIFPRIKLVSLGGSFGGQAPVVGLYFPVSMDFFQKNLDVRADVVFGAKVTQHRKFFRGCQPIETPFFDFYATSSNIDDSRR